MVRVGLTAGAAQRGLTATTAKRGKIRNKISIYDPLPVKY